MIGVVLITHGNIGESMLEVASRLVRINTGYVEVVSSCSYHQQALNVRLANTFEKMKNAHGYLVLTDLFGATPTNVTQSFMRKYNLVVITGINMPMLLKALTYHWKDLGLQTLVDKVYLAAKECIVLEQRGA